MKLKLKDKLLFFMALNSIFSVASTGINYDKMNDKIVKNLEAGKSNESSYKLIEKILNKRNKELKDLYMQGDYIVKPEYLEWQTFFSGFYNETDRKGNSTIKLYRPTQEIKEIELGINIPIYNVKVSEINTNIEKIQNPKDVIIERNIINPL